MLLFGTASPQGPRQGQLVGKKKSGSLTRPRPTLVDCDLLQPYSISVCLTR